jgi:hypothetical protein
LGTLLKRLSEVIGIHPDSKIIVCGCGQSLTTLKESYQDWITIGVNDVPALFEPTYLVVTDHPNRFYGKRKELINGSKAKYLFTCVNGWRHPNIVHFDLGSRELKNLNSSDKIDHFINSPYVATILAHKLGAKHIGLIGVDFTDGHFYNPSDGPHPVIKSNYLKKVNSAYNTLASALERRGTFVYNLSIQSRLEINKITLDEFKKL